MKLEYIWLVLGIIFIVMGISDLITYGSLRPLLTIAIGALVSYSSIRNLGGWNAVKWDLKKRLKL